MEGADEACLCMGIDSPVRSIVLSVYLYYIYSIPSFQGMFYVR